MLNHIKQLGLARAISRGAFIVLAAVFVAGVQLLNVAALSQDDITSIRNNTPFYDPSDTGQTCEVSSVTLTGSKVTEQIYNYLIGKGLKPFQAAGIMGNLQAESGMNPRRVQSTPTPSGDRDNMSVDGHTGYGLAQWTSLGRQQGLHAAAEKAGKIDGDLGVQLDFLWTELSGGYKSSTLTPLLASANVRQATSIYMIHFEAPKDQSQLAQNKRAAFSIAWLTKYGSTSPITTDVTSDVVTTDPCGGGNDGLAEGGFHLPVAPKWYDQQPVWFTKDHHDYPSADIPVPDGTPIFSVTDGKVIKAPINTATTSYGLGVEIRAPDGTLFYYAHGKDGGTVPGARQGDTVKAGQLIMHSGYTGNVQPPGPGGSHLHFEIRYNGNLESDRVCPQKLFVGIAKGNPPALSTLLNTGCSY